MTRRTGLCTSLPAALLLVVSCGEPADTITGPPERPSFQILDAAHNSGRSGFDFLPPLVRKPLFTGEFDSSLLPFLRVEICRLAGQQCAELVATFISGDAIGAQTLRISDDEGDEDDDRDGPHYIAIWKTGEANLNPAYNYRIRVLADEIEIGHADVDVVSKKGQLKNVNTGEYIPLKARRTLPIKFRIERGAVHIVCPEGGAVTSTDGAIGVSIPRGALTTCTPIDIAVQAVFPSDLAVVPGTAYELMPDGLVFDAPAQLTVTYDPANIPSGFFETSLRLFRASPGGWTPLPGGSANLSMHTVTAPINGFSTYAVLGTELQVASAGTFPVGPSEPNAYLVSDSWIVWLDRRNIDVPRCRELDPAAQCFPDLLAFNTNTAQETRITPPGALPGFTARIALSESRVAWVDNRSSPRPLELIVEEVHTLDLVTGLTRRVAGPGNPTDAFGRHHDFVLSGDRLAWWETRAPAPGVPTIVVLDLISGTESAFPISSTPRQLAISGSRLVWDTNGNRVFTLDLSTGIESPLPLTGVGGDPAISGNRVVWTEIRAGNADVFLLDLTTRTETRITSDPAAQFSPAISGDRVVFSDFRNDTGSLTNSDIYMIDLATGIETQITNDPGRQSRPKISGNNIVWHDSRIGGLVMYRIR